LKTFSALKLPLPRGTFTGAGVKTVMLFFEKDTSTKKVWFYQLNLDRNLGKTNSLNENDLADFVKLKKAFTLSQSNGESENSWTVLSKYLETGVDELDH